MRYKVVHITRYFYSDKVPLCHNVVHLKPRETPRQSLLSHALSILPNPESRDDRADFFGNPVTWFSLEEPHTSLEIIARSEVQVRPFQPPTALWAPPWEQVASMLKQRRDPDLLDARQFMFESPYVTVSPELREFALPSFQRGRPLLECATDLTNRIYKEFKFDSGVTTIGTPVLDVLRHRHGVCQDFAHLQIGCLRSLGLAARYVSGYLVTKPPPGRPRLVGADASHAWLSCYFPDFGWIDFDPTNGVIPSAEHVTVGWARDYDDVSPVRGVVVGGHRHTLVVSVDVEPVMPPAAAAAKIKAP
ncbi:MAG TPA: transglutaminase family protein [Tepidisphaeraceae bacterium]|nr:transglutaminase family protein [Tepidisphaeraceae bacterium]